MVHAFVADISIAVFTPNGLDFESENPIAELGAGVIQSGATSNQVHIVNAAADREFVINGINLTVSGGAVTRRHDGSGPGIRGSGGRALMANFSMQAFDAAAFYNAAVAAANGDGSALRR